MLLGMDAKAETQPAKIGIPHLHSFWERSLAQRNRGGPSDPRDWVADNTLLSALRLSLRETLDYLYSSQPAFSQFEDWVLERNGEAFEPAYIARVNAAIAGELREGGGTRELSRQELDFWEENGYLVVSNAVSAGQAAGAARAICEFAGARLDDPATWYRGPQGHSIWVPLLRHPALRAVRESPRIHGVFAQLWGRSDLWVNTDQCGFNPPERKGWVFPGPHLHWDTSLSLPIPFGVQGIVYLTDTPANQGAFRCVPGFHRKVETWLAGLPPGADPREQDLEALGAIPIVGKAGDLVVWHHALPHGASPNRASLPRIVQYLTLRPSQWEYQAEWR